MKTLTKKQLLAIDNLAIILKAKRDGLKLYADDLLINYAEIDHTLTDLEDSWSDRATEQMTIRFKKWLQTVATEKDLKNKKKMKLNLEPLFMDLIRSIWNYGQQTADQETQSMELAAYAERSGGVGSDTSDLTNTDAFEWYDLYTRQLAKQQVDAVFTYMQPLILEKLQAGTVRLELADALESDFRRYGQVRTQIIARTESNKAFNWGRRYRFDKSAAIAGYRYSAILDERTTEICQYLHGHSWEITDPELNPNTPPNHYQCRSILVAISKYVNFDFDPPESGWWDGLPSKEETVYKKFRDSTFYPKAETVTGKVIPKMAKPKMKAVPKADPAPVQDDPMRYNLDDFAHLDLTAADLQALDRFKELTEEIDFSKPRRTVVNKLLLKADLGFMDVSISKINSLGMVKYYDTPDGIDATDFLLLNKDSRPAHYQTRTIFHEFYHANYHGQHHDYRPKHSMGADRITRDEWLRIEETATETAAHFMLKYSGAGPQTIPSYSKYLTKMLPLLKQLPDFADCVSVEDFGLKMMKYRFSDEKSGKWKGLHDELTKLEKEMDWDEYFGEYEQTFQENYGEIRDEIFDAISEENKNSQKDRYYAAIEKQMEAGWENLSGGDIYLMSLLGAMQRKGVK